MGKKNKSSAVGPAKAATSGLSDYDIVRAECEKAVKSLKNNPPRAQKSIKETCQKYPNVSLGFRYHAYVEKRLAEQQHDASALKKRHVAVALEAAKQATVLNPNSVEHGYFYALLLQEYIPLEGRESNEEAIAECERALGIVEPTDPADDMLGELPDDLSTAKSRASHYKYQLRQLSHQMKLAGLQHVFKHVSVDADGKFVPLVANARTELPSAPLNPKMWYAKGSRKTSKAEVEQRPQTEVEDEGREEQRAGDVGETDGDEKGASENNEETLSEVESGGDSAGAEEGEELGQTPSSESAEPVTPGENADLDSTQEGVVESCEEVEEERFIKRKQHDWQLLRMVGREDLATVWSFLEDEVQHEDRETTKDEGETERTNTPGEPASSESPDPPTAAPAGEPGGSGAEGDSPSLPVAVVSEVVRSRSNGETLGLKYLTLADGSDGTVGIESLRQRNFVKEMLEDVTSWILPFGGKEMIQRISRGKGTELVKNLLVEYRTGTGVADLRGCPVRFRRMTSQQVGEVLDTFCSERAWWLFTWDLLRSPPEHFAVMRAWLEKPENDVIGETIRGMALAALRVRAHALATEYGAAKARLLAGAGASATREERQELARLALAAATATQEFASCIYCETTEFCGRKYADVLRFVYGKFTDEPTMKMVVMNAYWLDDVLPGKEARLAKVSAGHREWLQTHYNILGGLKSGLQTAIEELKFANVVNEKDESGLDSRTERRLKGWEAEGEARWAVGNYFNAPVIMTWARRKLGETGGNNYYSEKYLERALLKAVTGVDPRLLELQVKVALGERRAAVADELGSLLASALLSADGIPRQLKEAADQAAAELLRAESEPTEKTIKKRKKKKGVPKDKSARLLAASLSSEEVKRSAGATGESDPEQEAISQGNARLKGDDRGASPALRPSEKGLPTADAKDGIVCGEPKGGGKAVGTASLEGTVAVVAEAQEARTDPLPVDLLRGKVEAQSEAGGAEQGRRGGLTGPSDAAGTAASGSAKAALCAAERGAASGPVKGSSGGALDLAESPPGTAESAPHTPVTSATDAAKLETLPAAEGAQGPAQNDGGKAMDSAAPVESAPHTPVTSATEAADAETLPADEGVHESAENDGTERRNNGTASSEVPAESGAVDRVEALRRRNFVRETVDDVEGRIACVVDTTDCGAELTSRYLEYLSGSGVADLPGCPAGIFRRVSRAWDLHEYLLAACSEQAWWEFTLDLLRSPSEHFFQKDLWQWLAKRKNDGVGETIRCMAVAALKMREHALRLQYRAVEERLDRAMGSIDGRDASPEELRSALERLAISVTLTQAEFAKCLYCEALFFSGRKFPHVLHRVYRCFAEPPESKSLRDSLAAIKSAATCVEMALAQRGRTEAAAPEEHHAWVGEIFDLLEEQKLALEASLGEVNARKAAGRLQDEPGAKSWGSLTSSLNVPVVMTWVKRKVAEAGLSSRSAKRVEAILLDLREWEPDELHLALRSAFGAKGAGLATDLLVVVDSARGEPDGIPLLIKEAAAAADAETPAAAEVARGPAQTVGSRAKDSGARVKSAPHTPVTSADAGTLLADKGAQRAAQNDGTERQNDGTTSSDDRAESKPADSVAALQQRDFVKQFVGNVVDQVSCALGKDILAGVDPEVAASFVGPKWGQLTSSVNVPVIMTWVRRRFPEAGLSSGAVRRVEAILWDERDWGPTELHLALRSALGDKETAIALAKDLWIMLHGARDEPDGIPRQIKEAAEAAAAELLSAESAPDAKGTKKGKKKKKKGQSTDNAEGLPAPASSGAAGKVDASGDDVGSPHQLIPETSTSPDNGAGSTPTREAGYAEPGDKPGSQPGDEPGVNSGDQMTDWKSESSSRSGGGVDKSGGGVVQRNGRRWKGLFGPGAESASSRAPPERISVGGGAAEAVDVISGQHEVRGDAAPASMDVASGVVSTLSSNSVNVPGSTSPRSPTTGAFAAIAPGEPKTLTPGCRQPDAGGRSDVRTGPESHVAAGERPTASSGGGTLGGQASRSRTAASVPAIESPNAASGRQHTQQAAPKPYRPILPVVGPPAASRGATAGADVTHDDFGPLLPTPPLTPPSRGSQRAKAGSPKTQKTRSETAKRKSNREGKPSVAPPVVMLPGVNTPGLNASGDGILPSPRATANPLSQGSGRLQANPNPNPNPISDSNPRGPLATSEPPRKPLAYNPLAQGRSLAPAAPTGQSAVLPGQFGAPTGQSAVPTGQSAIPTGQSASPKPTGVPITPSKRRTPSVGQPAAKSSEPATVRVKATTSAEVSADVNGDMLRLMTGGLWDVIGSGAQRSPEPGLLSPELPSILAMLLPEVRTSVVPSDDSDSGKAESDPKTNTDVSSRQEANDEEADQDPPADRQENGSASGGRAKNGPESCGRAEGQ
ncbi:hypothetical protein KFL_002230050 [Klebsormidium nitens]|uniref:USP domain-containing protein n=1 Tax=Klebsormidium nitens TaxID=105231 RepID=A0A1Y1I2M8_KLENI|nr:hypothetical protein KFL_002230050 [Klebsormidium nitens]|eukprot:GAQ85185.1 hypothetical protein KFL_002230050 [Klebsormidium nitens]